ncbi:MAG: 2Fe-2S iron-sulfur cluster binding domain-containing protein [Saprospiraceae bacterium]|nr:2Fe-2S iron-sulfur cluster binding domain-containing protein [Saprospiraceae bacterium]
MDKLITLHITDRNDVIHEFEIPADCGFNLMEICKSAELGVMGTCGGLALCGSCQVYIQSDHVLHLPSDEELDMLDTLFHVNDTSRLACQIKVNESIDGIKFKIAPDQ